MQLTVSDVARLFKVPEKTVYAWIRQSLIPCCTINDQYRFNQVELLEWATSRGVPVPSELFSADDEAGNRLPGIHEALSVGGVVYGVKGNDQASVLKSIVSKLKLPREIDRDYLYQVLLARELLGSTGVGDGIAIPHARNPVVLNIPRPSVTLCFLEQAIEFNAIDGKPVAILFTIISPSTKIHLHLLSRLGLLFSYAPFKDALHRQAPREEILALAAKYEAEAVALVDMNRPASS